MSIAADLRRSLAAGVFALYALVSGFLVPFHAIHEAAEARNPTGTAVADRGPSFEAPCQERDCRDPSHHHGAHVHDPATCASCTQARLALDGAGALVAAAPGPVPAGRVAVASEAVVLDTAPALPRVRGPPSLS
jgi:hypothetical protein